MSKIVKLSAENVKRISAVQIKPDGSVVTISGRNGQGKSSILDAIVYALGGKSVQPVKPIREGATFAQVVLELDDLTVRRRWTANDRSTLVVESKDGARYPSPQAVLDKLVGALTFDPLAFSRMTPREQVSTLKAVANLDFAEQDALREDLFAQRTVVNRDVKAIEAQVAAIPEVDAPDDEVSVSSLLGKHAAARETLNVIGGKRDRLANLKTTIEASVQRVEELQLQIKAEKDRQATSAKYAGVLETELAAIVAPDMAAITVEMQEAESLNQRVRAKRQRAEKAGRLAAAQKRAEELTETIEAIDAKKRDALASTTMPVPGLSFAADGVTFEGVPFQQASAAEQLRVSVAMGLALNPKLRVMLIRDGSLLDANSLTLIGKLADEHDAQIWVERVSDGEAVGIVIEDGQVAGAEMALAAAE